MVTLPSRLAASWVAVLICAYILAAFSTPGSGLPPVALPAGIVVAAAVALPRPVAGVVCTAALVSLAIRKQHDLRDEVEDRAIEDALHHLHLGLELARVLG